MIDIRDIIFANILEQKYEALLIPEMDGCISGVAEACKYAYDLKIDLKLYFNEGDSIEAGKAVGIITANPKNIALAEEKIIGTLSKYSGIATASKKAVELSKGNVKIVSGSLKKMPPAMKEGIRTAIVSGGASCRLDDQMIYLDKNYIKMLGGIPEALESVKELTGYKKVIQIKGKNASIEEETKQAIENGCDILMIDTGIIEDLHRCIKVTDLMVYRNKVKIAFAGGVKIENIPELSKMDVDILCIGKDIVDAPLLDMKLDVI